MRRLLPLVVVLLVSSCAHVSFPKRETRVANGFTIEYSRGDEAYADLLAARLPEWETKAKAEKPPSPNAADLKRDRECLLQAVAEPLALAAPTKKMGETYDDFVSLFDEVAQRLGTMRKFALWRRAEVVARLQAGQKIPGFALEGATGLTYSINYSATLSDDSSTGRELKATKEMGAWPIDIHTDGQKSPEQELAEGLSEAAATWRQLDQRGMWAFLVLHETVEPTVMTYFRSADRRWLCDGIANYVAMKIIASEYGAEAAKRCYDLDEQLGRFADVAAQVDLEAWPTAENLERTGYAEDLNTANYAFATKVIADICAKHGDQILPKLFREVGQTPGDQANRETVYAAFHRLTGEDMRSYLPKVAEKAPTQAGKN